VFASTLHESVLYANQHNWQFKYDYQEKSHTKKEEKRCESIVNRKK